MKTITMTEFRKRPGEYAHEVYKHGESFLVTNQGKPWFKIMSIEDATIVKSDGTIVGPLPLTFRKNL